MTLRSGRHAVAWLGLLAVIFALPSAAQSPQHKHYEEPPPGTEAAADGAVAPRLQNLGRHGFPVTISSPEAQRFIDQGLNLSYGFNHAEAARAFREAERLDPESAMSLWGQALVLGPNINVPMDPEDEARAFELVRRAAELASGGSERERAYVEALSIRYSGDPDDRVERDRAYAEAMRDLSRRYPDDLDAATLFAEALMDLRPWDYWTRDGLPYPETSEIVAVLESILERNPIHPGANHLYIHAMESMHPDEAEAAADRLLGLMPGAGHMVHMPSHIYMRVGRYADAVVANQMAVAADEDYISQCRAQGIYPMAYYPHNLHFLWAAATMEGRSAEAIDAARRTAGQVSDEALAEIPILAGFRVIPYYALTRFGRWDEMLREPAPPEGQPYLRGTWHYARGLALLARGDVAAAEAELAAVQASLAEVPVDQTLFSPNTARSILSIAPEILAAEIAVRRGDHDGAVARLDRAVRLEDGLVYTEPEEWHYPPRLALGAVLLAAGRPAEAATVYWEELRQNPDNGWALFGVAQALAAQGRDDEARHAGERFERAWARADVALTASRF